MEASSPNAEFIRTWNEILVPKFVRFRHVLVDGFRGHSDAALAKHAPRAGERALDVACGFGDTSIDLARAVGPTGSVLGIDCCDAFLEFGRRDARAQGLDNLRFAVSDAQTESFHESFELCFARFGTMFFQSPLAAMRNLRQSLVPGGRLMMLVWRTLEDNDWLKFSKEVARKYLPPPPDTGQTCGPGPFSMADRETVTAILEGAGFSEIAFERIDAPVMVGKSPQEAVEFQLLLGPAGEIVREAGALGEQRRAEISAELAALLEKFQTERGIVMGSSSWNVTARRAS
ncbi:MAG TPA: class I SAM-dependent methyltransferase [Polyangiaceae bacterium]|jgi:ubiquinone/menaquinone biosynthesis C-methylase UbiE